MSPETWERVQAVFHQAVDLPPAERRAFVHASCGGDADVESAVLGMMVEDDRSRSPLDLDVAHVAHHVLDDTGSASLPFRTVGRYALQRRLGEGGMGVVYLAERADLGSAVAIKVLRDAWVSPSRRERFAAEQRTLAQLNHPSIARLYDADTLADGRRGLRWSTSAARRSPSTAARTSARSRSDCACFARSARRFSTRTSS
jgi:serine/threonine-protein kinase